MSNSATTEHLIHLTPRAVEEVNALRQKPDNAGKTLRVYVEQGGCSGMQYGLVFDEPRDGDHQSEFGDVTVMVDAFSANYLRGATVDFSDDLTGGGFKIKNPNAKQSCGCGSSFSS